MDKHSENENRNGEGQLNHVPRPPVTIKKSKVEDEYTIYEELGRGKYGVVKRVMKRATKEEFAAKWVKVTSETRDNVLHEIEIMRKLNHKRLVGLYDAYDFSTNFVLIMEYITDGELFERIANEDSVAEKECAYYMRQILEGLDYMHKRNIVHLDLKPENIVCVSKDTWDIKLIDFGLAKELKDGKNIKTMQGTPEFVAPEIVNFDPVRFASDMWSVGVIAYILVSGLSPFLGDNDNETLCYVTAAEYDFEDDAFNDISHEAKDFIHKLLQKLPSKRKTAEECLKHEWIKKHRGSNKIKTDNLKAFLAKRRWQKSVNALRAVRRLSSISSLFNDGSKAKSLSVAKLDETQEDADEPTPLATRRDFSKSMPSVFAAEGGQLNKRAMKILDSDTETSQSDSDSMELLNTPDVDDKDVLEGLFKENKEILEFLNSGLRVNKKQAPQVKKSEEKLRGISEGKDSEDANAKPEFIDPLSSTYTVPKGTPVLMTSTVSGFPAPNVTWFKHDKALAADDSDIRIEQDASKCSLAIGQFELQDERGYSCLAQNQFGKAKCNTKLDTQVAPEFVGEIRDVSVEKNENVIQEQLSDAPETKLPDSNNNNDEVDLLVAKLTKERDDLKQQLEELFVKYSNMEDELHSEKTAKKEQEKALRRLQERNKLLENRNIVSREATQRLIRLESEKRDLEDKFQQKDKKLTDLNNKYENILERAASCDALEDKVLYLEKERKTSETYCKKIEKQLKQLQEEHLVLKANTLAGNRRSMAEENENEVFESENGRGNFVDTEKSDPKENSSRELENRLQLMCKDLEIAQAEIQRLNATVASQLEDLEEMERVSEHKRKLETRCKDLEEQLVELEHEGTQREHEIDEMEEDILNLQAKLEKSHEKLRSMLDENKTLKQQLDSAEKTRGKIRDIAGHNGIVNDVGMNGEMESSEVKSSKLSAESDEERKAEQRNGATMTNGSDISDNEVVSDSDLYEEERAFSAKYYQLEKEIQDLFSEKLGEMTNSNGRC